MGGFSCHSALDNYLPRRLLIRVALTICAASCCLLRGVVELGASQISMNAVRHWVRETVACFICVHMHEFTQHFCSLSVKWRGYKYPTLVLGLLPKAATTLPVSVGVS